MNRTKILFAFLLLLVAPCLSLNTDGVLLLSFRYAILSDPLSVLDSWNYDDATPCSWTGVTCSHFADPPSPDPFRVTAVVLSNSKLLGSITQELGQIEHLRQLDLSGNLFNGTLPETIFNSTQLQFMSLAGNMISGELPESISQMKSLKLLNLSDNAFAGKVPDTLPELKNLTVVSLRSNYFSGDIPTGFDSVEDLDLSSNLFFGTLPLDFGGGNLRYLNLSYNKISGSISQEFAKRLPASSTIDLSFNNLTGPIPESSALMNQKTESFNGNGVLCGKPLKLLCSIPSTLSSPPNTSTAVSPAIAVLPRTVDSDPETNTPGGTGKAQNHAGGSMRPGTLAAIAVTNLAGLAILGMVILYVYQHKKRKNLENNQFAAKSQTKPEIAITKFHFEAEKSPPVSSCCLNMKHEQNLETTSSESDREDKKEAVSHNPSENYKKRGQLVTVDSETELELETLLKASAYILGASGSSIVYKAVLEDGTALAVRRIGESSVERLKDFDAQVRGIAKLKHPNLVKVRGFYWGEDENLLISDYVPNGSLAFSGYRSKPGSSPCHHLPLEVRLKIAKGVARGLAFIHEKKQVHGNIRPSNILLNSEMEPLITDFGLHRLISGKTVFKPSNSARFLSSYYPTPSRETAPHDHPAISSSPYAPAASSSAETASPYQAPESVQSLKPNSKWDVYSFGAILLELLSGRVFSERELNQWLESGSVDEAVNRVLRFVEGAIRRDVEGREDVFIECFKLGLRCASFMPQKRPSMREALQILEKMTTNILWV